MSEPESACCTTASRPAGLALRLRRETAEAHEAIEHLPDAPPPRRRSPWMTTGTTCAPSRRSTRPWSRRSMPA